MNLVRIWPLVTFSGSKDEEDIERANLWPQRSKNKTAEWPEGYTKQCIPQAIFELERLLAYGIIYEGDYFEGDIINTAK